MSILQRSIALLLLLLSFNAFAETTDEEVIAIVDKAIALFESDGADAAIAAINKEDGDFYIKEKGLYVFVYNEAVEIVAHPYKPHLIGKSYKGKPDVRGKKFRDEIVTKALANGADWTEYSYQKPGDKGIHAKKTYGKLVKKEGKKYVVCAGKYITK